jgi:hypothetical protein
LTEATVPDPAICVVGGSSLAHSLVAVLGSREEAEVRVLTRQPERWRACVKGHYRDLLIEGRLARAASDPAEVVPGAGIVLIAVPPAAHREVLLKVQPHLDPGAWVGGMPGYGGFDWQARRVLGRGPTLFGVQRIPYVSHVVEYGREVAITGIRPQLFLAALPATEVNEVAATLERLMHTRVVPTGNYLNVTLSTSNPIMHPARLYGLLSGWRPGQTYDRCPYFYRDWDEVSTVVYLRCADELQAVSRALPLDLGYVKGLVQHFEVATREDITAKIRGLASLAHRPAPLSRRESGGYEVDLQSRYFTEDIPYGILIQRAVAELVGVPTPMFDQIIRWAQGLMGAEFLVDGSVSGRSAAELPVPQHFGITTAAELVRRALI